jgi:signal transduction histidine kinase
LLLDALVGIGFLGVALASRKASLWMRGWWAMVAVAWWLGDIAAFRLLHQGVLIGALASFPTGRLRTLGQYVALGAGAVIATGYLGQGWAAVGFLATAAVGARRVSFAQLSAGIVGLWLAAIYIWSRAWPGTFQPSRALTGYELALLVIALALPWGLAAETRRRTALTDQVLAGGLTGLPGLEQALRRALHRRSLRLTHTADGVVVDGLGTVPTETSAAVDRAISLTVAHEDALAEAEHRLHELEAARVRLLTAADVERERAGRRLRHDLAALGACRGSVAQMPDVARELAAAVADIESIVAGLPPERLGGGGIGPALVQLCARHPVPVSLEWDEQATGDLATETALYFVCSEALANSAKHAHAHSVLVSLKSGPELVLTVVDDGVGGAHLHGSGLVGMQDRLVTIGGSLTLQSPSGGGTRIAARVPRRR